MKSSVKSEKEALKRMQKTRFALLTIKVNQIERKSFDSVVKSKISSLHQLKMISYGMNFVVLLQKNAANLLRSTAKRTFVWSAIKNHIHSLCSKNCLESLIVI